MGKALGLAYCLIKMDKISALLFIFALSIPFGYSQLAVPQTTATDPVFSLVGTTLGISAGNFYCGALDFSLDITNDGYSEILVGFPSMNQAFMVDGKTGNAIHTLNGPVSSTAFGAAMIPLHDVNGNGLDDFVVSDTSTLSALNTNDGNAYVYDGTGTVLYQVSGTVANEAFGTALANMGDITGDSIDDFAVSALASSKVYMFNGANGQLLYQITYPSWVVSAFGSSLTPIGDVNNDGISDLAVGAPMLSSSAMVNNGAVYVYSGASGGLITTIFGFISSQNFGRALAHADITGDGVKDLIVGASYTNSLQGAVYVYAGPSFSSSIQISGPPSGTLFGGSVAGGDLNRDGYDDLVVGHASNGPAYSYRGPGTVTSSTYGDNSLVPVLVASGDYNADGFDDVLVCDQNSGLRIYSDGGVYLYGQGQLGLTWNPNPVTAPSAIPASGFATISGGPANGQGYIATSYAPASIPLAGGTVLIDPSPVNLFPLIPFTFDATGSVVFPMSISSIAGTTTPQTKLHFQALAELSPGTYIFSPGMQVVLV